MAFVTLRVLDGADRGRIFDELPTPVTIGREEGNTIQLNDERISRFHLKIQEDHDKIVLTDLESTNGTKVNSEDIQLRILRFGDVISAGRSVLLYGSPEQIAERVAHLRQQDVDDAGTHVPRDAANSPRPANLDFDVDWSDDAVIPATLHALENPELPERLSPAQAAQLSELLEFLHIRMRELIESVTIQGPAERVSVAYEHWQNLLDLQARLAGFLRAIGEPRQSDD